MKAAFILKVLNLKDFEIGWESQTGRFIIIIWIRIILKIRWYLMEITQNFVTWLPLSSWPFLSPIFIFWTDTDSLKVQREFNFWSVKKGSFIKLTPINLCRAPALLYVHLHNIPPKMRVKVSRVKTQTYHLEHKC